MSFLLGEEGKSSRQEALPQLTKALPLTHSSKLDKKTKGNVHLSQAEIGLEFQMHIKQMYFMRDADLCLRPAQFAWLKLLEWLR